MRRCFSCGRDAFTPICVLCLAVLCLVIPRLAWAMAAPAIVWLWRYEL